MTSFHDDFQYRVNYAAQCLMRGIKSRKRDSCYENWDGDIVVTVLVRRSRNNPKLRDAIAKDWSGTFPQNWLDTAAAYDDTQTRKLPDIARKMREEAAVESEKRTKQWEAQAS